MIKSVRGLAAVLIVLSGSIAAVTPAHAQSNSAPTLSGSPPTTVTRGVAYDFTPHASDADGDRLIFRLANAPSWLTVDRRTGHLYAAVAATSGLTADAVDADLRLRVTDRKATTYLAPFSITVKSGASTPAMTIGGTPSGSAKVGTAYSFRPSVSNASGTVSFSVANKPSWATFNISTGQLGGTPAAGNVGTFSNVTISASTSSATAKLAPFAITVTAPAPPPPANAAPSISGTPGTQVVAGSPYGFQPSASDPEKATLSFAIQNKPTWASFNTGTGALTGTPNVSQVGSYGNIVISVSDGTQGRALPAFSILVTATAAGAATLNWTIPTQNTDGSSLSGLAGYRLYYGNSSSALNQTLQIANPGTSTTLVSNLTSGTWYFQITAYTSAGTESARSNLATKAIQ
jgi:hypothetical protein